MQPAATPRLMRGSGSGMPFHDREQEIGALEASWRAKDAQLVVVWGKRRVGKTALLQRFLARKPAVYYLADRRPARDQLADLAGRLGAHFQDEFVARKGFASWLEAFDYLRAKVKRRFLLVLDEFPYLAENDPATSSLFQKGWDETLGSLPICLVLCGSSMAMMESEVLSASAPLFGRRTADLLVRPLEFAPLEEFFPPSLGFVRRAEFYAAVGGMPGYLARMDARRTVEWNVRERILAPGTFLFREVDFLLREELREPRHYLSILAAIAHGRRKPSELASATGLSPGFLNRYLGTLAQLHLVEREVPVTEDHPEKSKRSLYALADAFVGLWFECVHRFRSDLELGTVEPALARFREVFPHLCGRAYERIARQTIRRAPDLPFHPERVGRWWDRQAEIDVVAVSEPANAILFGEAKWSPRRVGTDVLERLRAGAAQVDWGGPGRREHYALFARGGFTSELMRRAKGEGVLLFEGDRRVA